MNNFLYDDLYKITRINSNIRNINVDYFSLFQKKSMYEYIIEESPDIYCSIYDKLLGDDWFDGNDDQIIAIYACYLYKYFYQVKSNNYINYIQGIKKNNFHELSNYNNDCNFSQFASNFLSNHKNIIYHTTTKEKANEIMQNGLTPLTYDNKKLYFTLDKQHKENHVILKGILYIGDVFEDEIGFYTYNPVYNWKITK